MDAISLGIRIFSGNSNSVIEKFDDKIWLDLESGLDKEWDDNWEWDEIWEWDGDDKVLDDWDDKEWINDWDDDWDDDKEWNDDWDDDWDDDNNETGAWIFFSWLEMKLVGVFRFGW